MHQAVRISLAAALLASSGPPATAFDIPPGVNLPTIGLGAITRVPCDVWESQTPVPFVGSMEELIRLCPGDLSVQLYWVQTRLLRRHACYYIAGYVPEGRLVHVRHCVERDHPMITSHRGKPRRLRY
jgi:hypothetical protein